MNDEPEIAANCQELNSVGIAGLRWRRPFQRSNEVREFRGMLN